VRVFLNPTFDLHALKRILGTLAILGQQIYYESYNAGRVIVSRFIVIVIDLHTTRGSLKYIPLFWSTSDGCY
jgi:hypothetical protein